MSLLSTHLTRSAALAAATVTALAASPALAQVPLDRGDPSISARNAPAPTPDATVGEVPVSNVEAPAPPPRTSVVNVGRIVVDGITEIPADVLREITDPYLGRPLSSADLRALAGQVASVARGRGLIFATASIPAQSLAGDILHVELDLGRIDASRTLGPRNAAVDRLLGTLVGKGALRRAELERVLLLIGDVPGVRVVSSKYVRESGFGILLVTIQEDTAFAFIQTDNRGTREVGRVRSTALVNLRKVIVDGDEVGLIALNTPTHPREFAFVGGRYALPVGAHGQTVTVAASYGRSKPGASLRRLDVVSHSKEVSLGYTQPILRSRTRSLWLTTTLRRVEVDQNVLGNAARNDRLTTLSAGLNGSAPLAGGTLRAEGAVTAGVPLFGVTHRGDRLSSRADTSAKFVMASFEATWARSLVGPISLRVALAGQVASAPLLANAELGAGGPSFGRAYDYSERTGDQGALGSAELAVDARSLVRGVFDRAEAYGFIDGGYVDNLDGGFGGGSLLSAGLGMRAGRGALDGGVEVAFPLNNDRFDTGDRSPRGSAKVSLRL